MTRRQPHLDQKSISSKFVMAGYVKSRRPHGHSHTDAARLRPSSYWDSKFRQGPALIRARRPYLFKNIIYGTVITAFTIGICKC